MHAAVIDDFDGEQPGWTGWNPPAAPSDPAAQANLVSHRLRITTQFTTATDPANPMGHFCDVIYSTDLPVRQGQTLKLRGDLVSVNKDNLFACLVTMDTQGGEYVLMWDKNEVALLKWSQSAGFSVAFWETHSDLAFVDVVLALELTPDGDDLLIDVRVSRRLSGASVYQRSVRDTPASDWGVPDPLPHGWQIFGPDAGAPYKGDLKVVGLGVLHDTDGQQATAVVQFDNLEYRTILPTETYVIDDFEHGRKFMLWGAGGQPEWEFVGGEFNLHLPPGAWTSFFYNTDGVYELAEGQPVEFRMDVISANSSDVYVQVAAGFDSDGDDRGYSAFVFHNRVLLQKQYGGAYPYFFDQNVAANANPKTICLALTREGDNMRIGMKVVLRDDPQQVLFFKEVIDHPGTDSMVSDKDPGPPPAGPVAVVVWNCGCISGSNIELVVDNLVCSKDQSPVLVNIRRENASQAKLAWSGQKVAIESDSLHGPWRPCADPARTDAGDYTTMIGLRGSSQYFRAVRGWFRLDSLDVQPYDWAWMWRAASVVPGGTLRPAFIYDTAHSRGHILGSTTRNEDFMLRSNVGIWYRDCVGTVDILDWGDAMEDAAFGILLRAQPETVLWFTTTAGLPADRYLGLLTFKKADNPAESALSITGPGGEVLKEQRLAAVNPDKEYRLRFWAVGDQLTLELFDKENLDAPIQTITVTDGRIAEGMDGLYGTKSAGGTYEVWIDQYMFSGTTVY